MNLIRIPKRFKTKITLSILGVGLVTMLMGLSVTYWVGRTHLQNTIGAQYREFADATGQRLQFLIEHNIEEARLLALSSDIRSGIEQANTAYSRRRMAETDVRNRIEALKTLWSNSRGVNDPLVREFLNNPASDYIKQSLRNPANRAEHLSLIVTDRRGILVGADAKPRHVYYGDRAWWQAAFDNGRGRIYISDVHVLQEATEEFEKLYVLSISVPVMDATGTRAIGVLKSDLHIQQFFEAVTGVHIGASDHTMLASSDGTLIFCPIFLIRNHTLLPELMQAIFKDQPGWALTMADVHYAGRKTINGFAPVNPGLRTENIHPASLGGKRWYIFTSQNPAQTYVTINTLLNWNILLLVLGTVMLLILGLRASDYIVRPLHDLQKGVKLIGFGNLDHRLRIQTGDEIQEVADEFNEMAIKLQASYAGLEQKVAERTNELAVVNKITRIISSSLNITQIFESFCNEVNTLLQFDRISLSLLDDGLQKILFRLIKTKDGPVIQHDTPRDKTGTAIGWVVDHRQPCIRNDALETTEFFEDRLIQKEGLRSYIVVPIISRQTIFGTLNLVSSRPYAFSDRNLAILEPITEQMAIAIETIHLFEQTKKLDQLKSEFVSKVSHELRTPLTSIRGFTEILLSYQDVDHKTQQDFISIIHEESERLTRLINDVLDLSKIEAGRTEWHIQPLPPSDIVTHAVKSVRAMAMEKNLPIVIEVPESLPMIRGDRDQLIQILDNLLSNAIKFTHEGKITIRAASEDRRVRISVIDTGIGMSASDTEKIFDKFYQLGETRTGKPRGTGLGLAICREIVHYLGGKIWCESEPGKGSVFHFTLPVWRDDRRGVETGFKLEAAAPPSPGGRAPHPRKRTED